MALVPAAARGQGTVTGFADLHTLLHVRDIVIVTENDGSKTSGRVISIAPDALTIAKLVRGTRPGGQRTWTDGERRTFAIFEVARIAPSDLEGREQTPIYLGGEAFRGLERELTVGATAIVTDTSGAKFRGKVIRITPGALEMASPKDPGNRTFRPADVRRIQRRQRLPYGTLIGLGLGLLFEDDDDTTICVACKVIGPAIFGGIGALFDLTKGSTTILERVTSRQTVSAQPVLSRDRRGVRVAIRF